MIHVAPPLIIKPPRATWGSTVERERRNRIRIAVYAYAYECRDESLISDADYDRFARSINPSLPTGHPVLDHFFATRFTPDSGMWIRQHPALDGIATIYHRYYIQ